MKLKNFKALSFDCYGTLIDWETGIEALVKPWLAAMNSPIPVDLVLSSFALMQAKHQQVRPALLYTEVMRRTWHDIEGQFGWDENATHAEAFARSVSEWLPFADTVESLKYLSQYYKLIILSNVDNKSLAGTLKLLEAPFSFTVTAEDVGSYKPGLPHFEKAFQKLNAIGLQKDDLLHVAQSKHHDINPGRQLGLSTVWVNRRFGKRGSGATLATEAVPDITVTSLAELVQLHKAEMNATAA
jgi:2-haloacid dehalogenase/putative hydrolase of the HAD superfamily